MQITTDVSKGNAKIQSAIAVLDGAQRLVEQFGWQTMRDAKAVLEVYPATPAGIRSFKSQRIGPRGGRTVKVVRRRGRGYIRTGQLGRAWRITQTAAGNWTLSNNAQRKGRRYAVYVHGNALGQRQAWMHVGRWRIARGVVDQAKRKNTAGLQRALVELAKSKGLAA